MSRLARKRRHELALPGGRTAPAAPNPVLPPPPMPGLFSALMFGLVAGCLLLAFALLAGEVLEGDTRAFDAAMLSHAQWLRAGRPGLVGVMRDLSGLGSGVVLTLFVGITVVYLLVISARLTAVLVAVSAVSGSLLVTALKAWIARVRPEAPGSDLLLNDLVLRGLSFPSGHAAMSAVVFLTVGGLIASTRKARAERLMVLLAAALLTVLVGISRTVLGVHWATDVAGGWALGSGWALAWLLVARAVGHVGPVRSMAPLAASPPGRALGGRVHKPG